MKKVNTAANRGFTLLEIVVALAVLLIIASIAVVSYAKFIDNARETVCENNLKGLLDAVKIYGAENGALPATLGDLELDQLKKGYDLAMKNARWKTRLAHTLLEFSAPAKAHAFNLTYEDLRSYGASDAMFQCPQDYNGGASYAINSEIAGIRWGQIDGDVIMIVESDAYTFSDASDLQYRHEDKSTALAITMNGSIIKISNGKIESDGDDGDDEVVICHKGKTTKTKSGSALEDHLGHGDTLGPCP
jgi:prepilin-type N-terminal cleavage/methylation domain-containing protein